MISFIYHLFFSEHDGNENTILWCLIRAFGVRSWKILLSDIIACFERDDSILAAVLLAYVRVSHKSGYTNGCSPDNIEPNKKMKTLIISHAEQVKKRKQAN